MPSDQNSRSKDTHHVQNDPSNAVRNRNVRRRTRRAKCRARAVRSSSRSATSPRWSPSWFRRRWPASGSARRRSSSWWCSGRTSARYRRCSTSFLASRRCCRTARSRSRRTGQFPWRRGSRRGLERELHPRQLCRLWLRPWLPALALCGGGNCGLCLWRILRLLRGRTATTCRHTGETAPTGAFCVCPGN